MSDPNRRKHLRVKPKQLVTRVRAGEALHIGLGVENISMGGVFVRSSTPLKTGTVITLELMRPGATALLALPGKVTSSVSPAAAAQAQRSAGMGIAFDPLPPHLEKRLEGLIESIDPTALKAQPAPTLMMARKPTVGSPPPEPRGVPLAAPGPSSEVALLQRELKASRIETAALQRQVEELLKENKALWQRLRKLEG